VPPRYRFGFVTFLVPKRLFVCQLLMCNGAPFAPETNLTILSGDIGTQGDNSDNSYHVVIASGIDNTAILDGFTISDGNANGNFGGGMYNDFSSPTLENLRINDNSAGHGGGMFNISSNPILNDITFNFNSVTGHGGGMYNFNSSPDLINVFSPTIKLMV